MLLVIRAGGGSAAILAAILGGLFALTQIKPQTRARNRVEGWIYGALFVCSAIAVLTTLGIIASLAFDSFRFFQRVPVLDFLFGTQWSPQIAIRADQVGSSGAFGAVPLFAGTLLIMVIAMCVAAPIGLLPTRARFHWLTAKRSSIIQTSPVHMGRCGDLPATLEHLMDRMVRPPKATAPR